MNKEDYAKELTYIYWKAIELDNVEFAYSVLRNHPSEIGPCPSLAISERYAKLHGVEE